MCTILLANKNPRERAYVYRLGKWGVYRNTPPNDSTRRSESKLSDIDELRLCLSPPQALDSYREQVETMGDGEQVLCLLLCRARAVETGRQGQELAEHIQRRLGKADSDDDNEVRSFLHILCDYALHRAEQVYPDVRLEVQESVEFLMLNCCAAEAKTQQRKPYVIDIPKLMLLGYGMEVCGIDPERRRKKLIDFHVSRLSGTSSEVECESTLKKCLEWCCRKLSSPATCEFSFGILEMACADVDSGSFRKAIAYIFCFLLSEHAKEPNAVAVSRTVNEGLRLSICDLFYTLSALILVGVSEVAPLDLDHLCESSAHLMEAASHRAGEVVKKLPSQQHILVFFIEMYWDLTFPRAHSPEEKMFMQRVCGCAEALMRSLGEQTEMQTEDDESEFVNVDMYAQENHDLRCG